MITSWSHSRSVDFEQCKYRAQLKYLDKIPEPERPLPAGKTEHANDRGTRVHESLEDFVRGNGSLPAEARAFTPELEKAQRLYAQGKVSIEGEWGYNREWDPADWKAAWLRMKLDLMVHLSPEEAVVIDYKTGRKNGNEIKHGEQGQLYQLGAFMRYPQLETVHVEFWYLDQDDMTQRRYLRDQGLRFKPAWTRKGIAITSETNFTPNPNKFSCKYCPYGKPENGFPNGTGHCAVGRRT